MARRSTTPWPPDPARADQAGADAARLPVLAGDPGAEGLAVKLPDAGERHRVQDGPLARVLVRREPPAGEVGDLRGGGLAAGPQRHECHALLAEALVGPADDARHRD